MQISIVVPTYNEEKRIGKTIERIFQFFKKISDNFEIIVSDDGSQDKTCKIVKNLKSKYKDLILLENKHLGKGMTVKAGMAEARGELVLFTDADLATPIEEFSKLKKEFAKGADVVVGSRGLKREGAPIIRYVLSWGFNFLVRVLLGLNFSDTNCGFKAFRKQALEKILPKLKLYSATYEISGSRVSASFDLELLYVAKKLKLKIREVKVLWYHKASKAVRPVVESLLTFIDIFKIRFNDLVGKYG